MIEGYFEHLGLKTSKETLQQYYIAETEMVEEILESIENNTKALLE